MFLFPILIKFAVAAAIFWLISPRGHLDSTAKWGRRVAACFLVVIVIAYPFSSYSSSEWKVAIFMAASAWIAGFALGWLAGLIVLRLKANR